MSKKASNKTVFDLEAGDCRWPIGDPRQPGFHFCAAHQVPGSPYCKEHRAESFIPPRPRGQSVPQPFPMLTARKAA